METLASGYGLIEGPVWDPERGLLFSDVINGGVRCLTATGAIEDVWPHRRGIGGMALHADGGLVVSGRNVAYKALGGGETMVIREGDPEHGVLGYNDLAPDPEGRIYVGSLAHRPVGSDDEAKPGNLYVIDLDGTSRVLAEDVLLTNGLGVSPERPAPLSFGFGPPRRACLRADRGWWGLPDARSSPGSARAFPTVSPWPRTARSGSPSATAAP